MIMQQMDVNIAADQKRQTPYLHQKMVVFYAFLAYYKNLISS